MIVSGSNILIIFNELFHKWTYLQNRIVTDLENTLMVIKGKKGGWVTWDIGIDIYTFLNIK